MPNITYIYDDLGRLKAVVDPAGDTGAYTYDAVSNMLSIEGNSSSVVSIIEFTPKSAPVGTSVTVHGTGFSETPGENVVKFNDIPSTIVSATATQIVAIVPSGAASGPIKVTTSTASATSTIPFTMTAAPEAPAIAVFSPSIGVPGTRVTITGTHFGTTLANNKVMFNRVLAILSSATTNNIETEVPPALGSGRIVVVTPFGTGTSSEDFFIPPSPRTVADVELTARVELGESKAVTFGTPNKIALVVFDGAAGQRINLGVSKVNFGNHLGTFEVSILDPYGAKLASRDINGSDGESIHTNPLPASGSYTIVVDPRTLTPSLVLTVSETVTAKMTIDGPSVPVVIDKPGQNARLTFEGTTGQRIDLGISEVSFETPTFLEVSILSPDGNTLASRDVYSNGGSIQLDPLPATGTYSIQVNPRIPITVNLNLTLSKPLAGTITIDGPSVPVTLRQGQAARLTFESIAGQRVNLGVTEVNFGTGDYVLISILKPDETALVSTTIYSDGGDLESDSLPATGTYTIVVNPVGAAFNPGATTAKLTLTLSIVS